jgi:hypothetical protein
MSQQASSDGIVTDAKRRVIPGTATSRPRPLYQSAQRRLIAAAVAKAMARQRAKNEA